MLYNSGRYKLARRRKLNYREIKELAEEYYNDRFERANDFYEMQCMTKRREI